MFLNHKRLNTGLSALLGNVVFSLMVAVSASKANAQPIKIAKLPTFKNQQELCSYLSEKKTYAESMMRRSYKAHQYDKLEAKRKYWKNLYVEHCFD